MKNSKLFSYAKENRSLADIQILASDLYLHVTFCAVNSIPGFEL